MAAITPELIKELRMRTGVGVGKCKEALQQTGGNVEEAIAFLRKAGIASAVKKGGRETKEGQIVIHEEDGQIGIVEVNAETDFVVKNTNFQDFAKVIGKEASLGNHATVDEFLKAKCSHDPAMTIDDFRAVTIQSLGENIQISRLALLKKSADHSIGLYSHMGGKIVTAVEIDGSSEAGGLAREIAMHVAAEAPSYLDADEVPAEVKAQEEEIARGQVKGKPPQIIDKIVEGKLRAFYEQSCLLRQKSVKEPDKTISQLVELRAKELGKPLTVKHFLRWQVGDAR